MQGRGDQRKAGLNWTATTRNGEGGDESVVVRREGGQEQGGCPCVDGGVCPTAGKPCPNLRKPDVSAQPLCPPPPACRGHSPCSSASWPLCGFVPGCSCLEAALDEQGQAAPQGSRPVWAERAHCQCGSQVPGQGTPARPPHAAKGFCATQAITNEDKGIIHFLNNRIWQMAVPGQRPVTHIPGRRAVCASQQSFREN